MWITRVPWLFVLIAIVFLYTTVVNMIERPDGIKIASWFIIAIVAVASFGSPAAHAAPSCGSRISSSPIWNRGFCGIASSIWNFQCWFRIVPAAAVLTTKKLRSAC